MGRSIKARHDEQVHKRPRAGDRADIAPLLLLFWYLWSWCRSVDYAREDALPQAGADLVGRGVAGEVNLDDGVGNVGFADVEEVLITGRGLVAVKGLRSTHLGSR